MSTSSRNSLLVLAASLFFSGVTHADALTVLVGGGNQADATIAAYVTPFEKETGIKVNAVKQQCAPAVVRTMVQSNRHDIDICMLSGASLIALAREGMLTPLDYKLISPLTMKEIEKEVVHEFGVGAYNYAVTLGFDRAKYSKGRPPGSWKEFWDVKQFPGTRVLQSGAYPNQGPWEEALLADGVPADKLYPIDVDRALKSLDKLKPVIRKWWMVGSEQEQLFASGAATGQGFDGIFQNMMKGNKNIAYTYNQAKMYSLHLTIPKGSKNIEAAHKFIDFVLKDKPQAEFAKLSGYSPTNQSAFKLMEPAFASTLVGAPGNRELAYYSNAKWYSEVGPSGKTNAETLIQRWNEWVLK